MDQWITELLEYCRASNSINPKIPYSNHPAIQLFFISPQREHGIGPAKAKPI